jgi:hypothetical protein
MKKKLSKLFENVSIGNASIFEGENYNNQIFKFFGTGYFLAFYFFNKKQAVKDTKKSFLYSNFELSRKFWNLLDTKIIKSGYKGVLGTISNIKFRRKLFLKKTEKRIDLKILKKYNDDINSGIIYEQEEINIESSHLNFEDIYQNKKQEKEGELFTFKRNRKLNDSKIFFLYYFFISYFLIRLCKGKIITY